MSGAALVLPLDTSYPTIEVITTRWKCEATRSRRFAESSQRTNNHIREVATYDTLQPAPRCLQQQTKPARYAVLRPPLSKNEALHPDWPAVAFEGDHRADLKRYVHTYNSRRIYVFVESRRVSEVGCWLRGACLVACARRPSVKRERWGDFLPHAVFQQRAWGER